MNAQVKAAAGRVPLWAWIAGPLLVAGLFGWRFYAGSQAVGTNNAYVKADRLMVSAQVAGRVVEVAVTQNQAVKKGQLLFRLDDEPMKIALAQAEAKLGQITADFTSKGSRLRELIKLIVKSEPFRTRHGEKGGDQ